MLQPNNLCGYVNKPCNLIYLDTSANNTYGLYQTIKLALEEVIERQVSEFALVQPLQRAVEYALFPPGKRLRPMLACLLCADLQGEVDLMLQIAPALEYLHCASLVHDDLPALDDDDMRRGKPACHKKYPEATAILTGDVLVPLAFRTVLSADFDSSRKAQLGVILSTAYTDLCSGQQLDLLPASERGELETVHQLKTGCLFKAACQFAAVGSGREPDQFAALGLQVGTLFQFIDDMLDVFGEHEAKGRSERSDLKNEKQTLATSGNREIFNRRLASLRNAIESTFTEVLGGDPASSRDFPNFRFLLNELFSRAERM